MFNLVYKLKKLNNKIKIFIALGVVLVVALSLIVLNSFNHLSSEYDFNDRLKNIYLSEEEAFKVEAFAKNLAVISDVSTDDASYQPEAGLVAKIGGPDVTFARNANKHMNPASTTKVMTALLALKYGKLDTEVTVGREINDVDEGSSLAGLRVGDTLSLEELLYALLLPSGNDAANAIAVHISGSKDAFVELMNQEAKKLGAMHTNFENPSGLTSENHYTTAYDLYLIFNEALKYEKFAKIAGKKNYTASYTKANGTEVIKAWSNGNRFLGNEMQKPEGVKVFAGKTGTTKAAGSCLVVACTKEDSKYISVVLKSENKAILYDNMYKLMQKYTN
jgi:serine-type D-ala-D-ala carboxypeptidase